MIDWQWCRLEDLTAMQLYAVFATREAVFVVEQKCAYQELDGLDACSHHLVAWSDEEVAAYLRVVEPGAKFAEPSIGRVLTTRDFRRRGLGRELMRKALEHIEALYPGLAIRISAQTYLGEFYAGFGFAACSEIYLEDGIPHVEMLRAAQLSPPIRFTSDHLQREPAHHHQPHEGRAGRDPERQ